MRLRNLIIQGFRNIERIELRPFNGLNVVFGSNGAGKTNLLEAIGCLSHGKSLRIKSTNELIRENSRYCRLHGDFIDDSGRRTTTECHLTPGLGKTIRVNGKPIRRISEVFRSVPTVQFFENDTQILQGPPGARRAFLDCLCTQLSNGYLLHQTKYREVLQQRNELIRRGETDSRMFRVINELFIKHSCCVTAQRMETIHALNELLQANSSDYVGEMNIRFVPPTKFHDKDYRASLEENLVKGRVEEQRYGRTLFGPHRDAFSFELGSVHIRHKASRGQIKNILLRIKLAEYQLLYRHLRTTPIVLLDDVFAEMDVERRDNISVFTDLEAQIFWASTSGTPPRSIKRVPKYFVEISHGTIAKCHMHEAAA